MPGKPPMMNKREIHTLYYQEVKESQRAVFELQAHYGKWLITTLSLIHAGGLFGLFALLDRVVDDPNAIGVVAAPAWALIAGLLLSLLTGFVTWLNWTYLFEHYSQNAPLQMLWDEDYTFPKLETARGILITYWLSMIFGFSSAACIPVAAFLLFAIA